MVKHYQVIESGLKRESLEVILYLYITFSNNSGKNLA